MILPAKHLSQERSLVGIGAQILSVVEEGRTVSELWEAVQRRRPVLAPAISFDWFVLSLDMLFTISAIDVENGVVTVRAST
ncbi:MAG: hypothetical protein EOP84_22530 [Verrucomicrobiaceae bacterium]|nr:MAG: hypothetical protein EOP84_22530 [Verrucomicrobiaceae bacterium]